MLSLHRLHILSNALQESFFVEQQNAAPVVTVTPLDELNANVEEFRNKLKLLLEESGALTRKVKDVSR